MKEVSVTLAVLFVCVATARQAGATTITFETAVPIGGCTPSTTTTVSDGFIFGSTHQHVCDGTSSAFVANGTNYLALDEATSVTMTESGGNSFSLTAFDLAELQLPPAFFFAPFLDVTGLLSGGGTVTTPRIALDGVADGPGGVADFQHVTLTGFDNLISVTFAGFTAATGGQPITAFSLDNIVATPAPEPSSLVLVGTGLVGAIRRFRRRNRSSR